MDTDVVNTSELERRIRLIPHIQGSLFDHGKRVSSLIEKWNMPQRVATAGLYHSIYGRHFTRFLAPVHFTEREQIRAILGAAEERLIYLNCVYTHESFWRSLHYDDLRLQSRLNSEDSFVVTPDEQLALLNISLANMIDHLQTERIDAEFKWRELSLLIQYSSKFAPQARELFFEKCRISIA